jgi:hypothetical protein
VPTKGLNRVSADKAVSRAAITEQVKEQNVSQDRRMHRRAAREYLEQQLGRPVSDTTLIYVWRIEHFRDGRHSIYLQSTLDRFVARRIAQVSQQVFGGEV